MKNIIELIEIGLKAEGKDGLYYDHACACKLGDLNPCGNISTGCMAGYVQMHSNGVDFAVTKSHEKISDDEIERICDV